MTTAQIFTTPAIAVDLDRMTAVVRQMTAAAEAAKPVIERHMKAVSQALRATTVALSDLANREEVIAGLEAKYYVRGALLPGAEAELGALLRAESPDTMYLHPANRARLGAALITGMALHTGEDTAPETLAWVRLIGKDRVAVTRG